MFIYIPADGPNGAIWINLANVSRVLEISKHLALYYVGEAIPFVLSVEQSKDFRNYLATQNTVALPAAADFDARISRRGQLKEGVCHA
jgi:hypothetical protein